METPFKAAVAAVIAAVCTSPALAVTAHYADFSTATGLTLNGDAAQAGNALRLVPSAATQSGTAYLSSAVAWDAGTSFSTSFKFNVTSDPLSTLGVTDGFAFLLQNSASGAGALGAGGQGLGYVGITPSVAVVFRGRDPNVIGVIANGVDPADLAVPFQPAGYYGGTEGEFYDRDEFAWIDYASGTHTLSVFLSTGSTKPGSPVMTTTVDLFGTLGSQAYVGFSAGNGGAYGSQDILSWSFTTTPVPEPDTWLMLVGGLGLVGGTMRRRKATQECM